MQKLNIEEREKICKECPIYNPVTDRCNSNLWLNPNTNDVSTYAKIGYIRGCNCVMKFKLRNINNHCVAGKW